MINGHLQFTLQNSSPLSVSMIATVRGLVEWYGTGVSGELADARGFSIQKHI